MASRRAAEKLILEGRVSVNGETVRELGSKADPDVDEVRVDDRRIKKTQRARYILLNKPRGYVSTRSDPEKRRTVIDLLKGVREYVYPVGRLDYDSEGLLILTNDTEFARRSLPDGVFGMVPGPRTTTLRGRTSTSATTSRATLCSMRRTTAGSCQLLDSTATANDSRECPASSRTATAQPGRTPATRPARGCDFQALQNP